MHIAWAPEFSERAGMEGTLKIEGYKSYMILDHPLYLCDVSKNTQCSKEQCGWCYLTLDKEVALEEDPITVIEL